MSLFPTTPVPSYPIEIGQEFKTAVSDFQSGKEARRQIWTFPKRTINLKFDVLTQANTDTLWNFYFQRKGAFIAFWYFWPLQNVGGGWPSCTGEYVGRGVARKFSGGTVTGGPFASGETITQTGTAATFLYVGNDATFLYMTDVSGTPNGTGLLTGGTSAATYTPTTTTAAQTIFELPSKSTTGLTVYVNGTSTGVTFLSGGGDEGVDRIQFATAPAHGALITADFTGQQRFRMRFKEDMGSKSLFLSVLYNMGLALQEVRI